MDGTVKWFNTNKGYGFIAGDDGEEYFVHFSSVPDNAELKENDRVSFQMVNAERGKQAKGLLLIKEEQNE